MTAGDKSMKLSHRAPTENSGAVAAGNRRPPIRVLRAGFPSFRRNKRATVTKLAIALSLPFALAACAPDTSTLFLPMEPTRASIAAPRRALTDAEKAAISEAVARKLGGLYHRDFKWFPLIVRPHDHVVDFCGLVTGDAIVGEYDIRDANTTLRDYYAQLTFDRRGSLSKVNVVAVGAAKSDNTPTAVDSICIQDGYDLFPSGAPSSEPGGAFSAEPRAG